MGLLSPRFNSGAKKVIAAASGARENPAACKSNNHGKDFLDCMRSRKRPICDVEIGCRSATVCHAGNLAYWNHRRLKWDPAAERFVGDDEANKRLDRPKRGGWTV
jgi:hypothetical protein